VADVQDEGLSGQDLREACGVHALRAGEIVRAGVSRADLAAKIAAHQKVADHRLPVAEEKAD
jgi:hypothetical protein